MSIIAELKKAEAIIAAAEAEVERKRLTVVPGTLRDRQAAEIITRTAVISNHIGQLMAYIREANKAAEAAEVDQVDQEYWDRLEKADWYYSFSDDNSVWKRGKAEMQSLEKDANTPWRREALATYKRYIASRGNDTPAPVATSISVPCGC